MYKEDGWIQIRNQKEKDLSMSQEVRSERQSPLTLRWGNMQEEEGRVEEDMRENNLMITVRSSEFDDDKFLFLVEALLGISS